MRNMNISYDEKCREEFALLYSRLENYFISISINCPYGLPHIATFHQATFAPLSERAMELFLSAGYRRNGNCLYDMRCATCSACLPIRLHPADFRPNRNQKRAVKKNSDLEVFLLPLRFEDEHIQLCERFLQSRYPKESNSARGYYRDFFLNNIVNSAQLEYRIQGRLVGTSIVDIGYNWVNAVYFFFDPDESSRSLGTFNIMNLIDICREWDIMYLYLGYLIKSVSAMKYKQAFCPHHLLLNKKWQLQK